MPGAGAATTPGPAPMDTYRTWVVNPHSGYCLAASESPGERPVVQTTCGDWADRWWYLYPQ